MTTLAHICLFQYITFALRMLQQRIRKEFYNSILNYHQHIWKMLIPQNLKLIQHQHLKYYDYWF